MKAITDGDVEKLRQKIRRGHEKFLEEYTVAVQSLGEEKSKMLQRLESIEEEIEAILEMPDESDATEARAQALFREANELRVYFGAPTGRPLEERGVDFVEPYLRSLRLLFQFDRSMILYVEMIRTELALLEYRLAHGQSIADRLASLTAHIEQLELADEFSNIEDVHAVDLQNYLLTIHELLMPLVYERSQEALRMPLSRTYIAMGVAFAIFDCLPEAPDPLLLNTLIVSMVVQLLRSEPDPYAAVYCQTVAKMLWEYDLPETQKQDVAFCYQKAGEVLGNA